MAISLKLSESLVDQASGLWVILASPFNNLIDHIMQRHDAQLLARLTQT